MKQKKMVWALVLLIAGGGIYFSLRTAVKKNHLPLTARIIRMPIALGADRYPGVAEGPRIADEILRHRISIFQLDASPRATSVPLSYRLEDFSRDWEIPVEPLESMDQRPEYQTVHHLDAIVKAITLLREKVALTLNENKFPIILGGDHSLSMGSVSGLMTSKFRNKKIGMIWIDGHSDYQTGLKGEQIQSPEYESAFFTREFSKQRTSSTSTGHIHGMSAAVCTGRGDPSLIGLFKKNFVDSQNVVMIGLRDVEREQREMMHEDGIQSFTARQIEYFGIAEIARKTVRHLKQQKVEGVHISFDMDVIDGSLISGVGTPISGGMSVREADLLIALLRDWLPAQGIQILSFDLAELNPELDEPSFQPTVRAAAHILSTLLGEEIIVGESFNF